VLERISVMGTENSSRFTSCELERISAADFGGGEYSGAGTEFGRCHRNPFQIYIMCAGADLGFGAYFGAGMNFVLRTSALGRILALERIRKG
jgi:hypothetical protein